MAESIDYDECLAAALEAANLAGAEIRNAWDAERTVEYKGDVDLVTATDKKCEDLIFELLKSKFPSHSFVGEESVAAADGKIPDIGDEPTWFVDPLDGTTNFVHGFPFSCVSVGLAVNKVPMVGVVLNPILNETFTAVKDKGAHLNGKAISASAVSQLGKALIATEIGVSRDAATVAQAAANPYVVTIVPNGDPSLDLSNAQLATTIARRLCIPQPISTSSIDAADQTFVCPACQRRHANGHLDQALICFRHGGVGRTRWHNSIQHEVGAFTSSVGHHNRFEPSGRPQLG